MFARSGLLAFTLITLVGLAGCSGSASDVDKSPIYVNDIEIHDPWEEYNREVFAVNDALDEAFLEPVARGYSNVMPDFAEDGVRNALRNLRSPVDFSNQVLQADFEGALETLTRTMINTSFGVLGFVDLAGDAGIEYESEDLGQTLAVWGVDYGPYLVVPFYGPGTVRDHAATFIETTASPFRFYMFNVNEEEIYFAVVALGLLDTRVQLLDVLADLKESSIDYYAAVRSSYYQNREARINDTDETRNAIPQIPDFD